MAQRYIQALADDPNLGFFVEGYLASQDTIPDLGYLGNLDDLSSVLSDYQPDEVVAALSAQEFSLTPTIIEICEKEGIKLSIIPFYAEYMPSNPQFDNINGIPVMNIRRIPLDNLVYAVVKRTMDIVGSLLLILLNIVYMYTPLQDIRIQVCGSSLNVFDIACGIIALLLFVIYIIQLAKDAPGFLAQDKENRRT